ncbi:hypothetical protein L218DRAFT_985576 [Marasmius fiardii PR-910]|nr:hypothetical protein L218DRAFT_985576 [Marasmius fiardii PR-910]
MNSNATQSLQSLENFIPIGKGVYLRKAAQAIHGAQGRSPNVILIFGWMAAKLGHLQKYTKAYEELYPEATQVVVRNEPGFFFSREATRQKNLRPVAETLEALGCTPSTSSNKKDSKYENGEVNGVDSAPPTGTPRPRILIHSFSNGKSQPLVARVQVLNFLSFPIGGASQLYTLSNLLRARGITHSSYQPSIWRPISAMIIDSSPANGTIQTGLRAFTMHIKSPFLRVSIRMILTVFFSIRMFFDRILGIARPPFEHVKSALNSPHLLPWMDLNTPRVYLYSRRDELVPWKEVEEHVKKAKARGLNVEEEVFETAPHVALARTEPERYWEVVKRTWGRAVEVTGNLNDCKISF